MEMKKSSTLIVGLGNYIYPKSRHSIGMSICDKIASQYNLSWKYSFDYKAYTTQLSNITNDIIMLKSKYPMNMNGKSVKAIVKGLDIENIFVVHDDLDRPLGKLSLKTCGSAGGHNGVKSIISCLGTDKFRRLRVGIGRPINPNEVTRYVLADFDLSEKMI